MVYLFYILTNDGTWSGYASNIKEMEQDFTKSHPEITEFKAFLYGDVPEFVSLNKYNKALDIFKSHEMARKVLWLLDDGDILEELKND